MTMRPLAALLVVHIHWLLLLAMVPPRVQSSPAPAPSAFHHLALAAHEYNATVYKASAARCAGCGGGGDGPATNAATLGGLGAWAEAVEFLYYHNAVRMARWELPLTWSTRLESYARWWASQRRGDCALRHSFPEGQFALGENIFWGGAGAAWSPGDAVKDWAAEGVDYSYAANACAPGRDCGHYTQIVWRGTASVGCARVVCDDGGVFITCNYYPPGNVVGQRPY
ncbi:pathogenesis-related protein PRB1-3-like [Lolium perenne]|uniref:pathogenesis-related protein PRB1-3-like n=1 Tax=Lolium perenne TaxID=4522 RepID=UPI0021EB1D2C|nr:pathogenesis-related protein PRB1-3-like [Lolium perenne]